MLEFESIEDCFISDSRCFNTLRHINKTLPKRFNGLLFYYSFISEVGSFSSNVIAARVGVTANPNPKY